MKRVAAVLLSALFCLLLCCCGSETGEPVRLEVPSYTAVPDEYGNPFINYETSDKAAVMCTLPQGYSLINPKDAADDNPVGIDNDSGELVLDYICLEYSDAVNLIDYEFSVSSRPELFSREFQSENYRCFVSAMANGGDWINRNATVDSPGSGYYGYLLDCTVQLDEEHFLAFHYYFNGEKQYDSYDELPEEVRREVVALADCFCL